MKRAAIATELMLLAPERTLAASLHAGWAGPNPTTTSALTLSLEAARANLATRGAELTLLTTDLAVPDDLQAAAASLPASLWQNPPSLVLAHALSGKGPGAKSARLGDLDHDHWQGVLDVNLTSAVFTIQAFLPFMKQAGGGRIVLVSSTAGVSASPTAALSYSVSKAAIAALPPASANTDR